MSADDWDYCPRCRDNAQKRREDLLRREKEDYGKIPANEYLDLIDEINNPPQLKPTLAEYYTIGMSQNLTTFVVSYTGKCDVCGFRYEYKYQKPLKEEPF